MNNQNSPERLKLVVPAEIAQGRLDEVTYSLGDLERVLGIAMETLAKPVQQPEYSFTPSVEQQPMVDELAARRRAREAAARTEEVAQVRYDYGAPYVKKAA